MSCRRIEDLDLPGFLTEPTRDEFRSFREHYPACPECAAEIRAWTQLHLELTADAAGHPTPEDLLRLQDDPASLSSEERDRLAGHVAACATCTQEVRALETFALAPPEAELPDGDDETDDHDRAAGFAPAAAISTSSARFAGSEGDGDFERLIREELDRSDDEAAARGEIPGVRYATRVARIVWTPAFAYAALLLVTLPLVYLRRDVVVEPVQQSLAPPAAKLAEPRRPSVAAARQTAPHAPTTAGDDAAAGLSASVDEGVALDDAAAGRPMAAPPRRKQEAARAATIQAERIGADLIVTIRSSRLAGPGPLEVRVSAASGRELRQPIPRPEPGRPIRFTLPATWLGDGRYRLQLRTPEGETLDFTVRVPAD